jgi:hypothetical protein
MATPEEEEAIAKAAAIEEAEALAVAEAEEEEAAAVALEEEEEAGAAAEAVDTAGTPKKGSFQDRINTITHKFRSAERELDYYKNIVLGKDKSGGGSFSKPAGQVADRSVDTPGGTRPKTGDFETVEAYEDALYGWYDAKREKKASAATAESNFKELLSDFNKSAAPLRIEYPDFDEVTARPVFTDSMRRAIFSLDEGALVAYELGKNPALAEKIKVLPLEKQLYEISKLERKLTLVRKVRVKSGTPDPLHPITGRTKKEVNPDEMSTGAWMEWEKNQRMAKLKTKLGIK